MFGTRSSHRNQSPQVKRYNNPGSFVPASQPIQNQQYPQQAWPQQPTNVGAVPVAPVPVPPVLEPIPMCVTPVPSEDASSEKKWLKKGYKLSMKEKRRRQNRTLRKLITPKNALMVLNELAGGSQQDCTVLADADSYGPDQINRQYVAILNMGGKEYSGKGSTKLMAKNQAAECVIRDLIIKQMNQVPCVESANGNEMEEDKDDQSFPMIQLASYALHKLFSEWQTEGYKIPQFGQGKGDSCPGTPGGLIPSSQVKPKKTPTLPANPETLHPCTLLSQMRGTLEYVCLSMEGNPPNGQFFTMAVNIDNKTYAGRANSKKEARKLAAKKACIDLLGINYPEEI